MNSYRKMITFSILIIMCVSLIAGCKEKQSQYPNVEIINGGVIKVVDKQSASTQSIRDKHI